jgi:cytochrome c1
MRNMMSAVVLAALMLAAGLAWAGEKTYQVTGPVLELTDTTIVVQKGDEKWAVHRAKDTKVTGDLKVGAKVTIKYTMTATDVEVKADK